MYTATGLPLAVLILTSFFKTLPHELEEAARIDGAGDFRILRSIIFPLMRPVLGTVMIVNFIGAWNDFFFPLIFITDVPRKPFRLACYPYSENILQTGAPCSPD